MKGLLKFWPITCPAKEVIFINVIEEVLELNPSFGENGVNLCKRIVSVSRGMHYQAAEKSLMMLNSDLFQKLVKS